MKLSVLPPSLLLCLFLLIHSSHSHDITQVLNTYPEFSSFNSYLTQTNLAAQINAQPTVTVLVVDNANLASLTSSSLDLIHNILAVHVILDYYDSAKLQTLSSTSALATTIFQSSGYAKGQQGFLNVSRIGTGPVSFTSAMPGSPPGSTFIKSVYSLPYNFSVLQISNAIIPQGIDGSKTSSPPSTSPSATTPPPPAAVSATPPTSAVPSTVPPTPSAAATVPSKAPPTSSSAPPPLPSTGSPKPSTAPLPSSIPPSTSKAPLPSSVPPTSQGPTIAATPSASTPTVAMGPGGAAPTILDTPGETTPAAEGAPKAKSASKTLDVGLAVVFTMVLSTLYLSSSTI